MNHQQKRLKQLAKYAERLERKPQARGLKIRFQLRYNRIDATRQASIYCYLTINGKEHTPFSTSLHCLPQKWNSKLQEVEGDDATTAILAKISADVRQIHSNLILNEQRVTFEVLK